MKIFGLIIIKQKTMDMALNEKQHIQETLDTMKMLTSDFIPDIEQLLVIRREARVGASSYGRRKKYRKLSRKAQEIRTKIKEVQNAA